MANLSSYSILSTGRQYQFNGVTNVTRPGPDQSAAKALLQYIPLPNIATTADWTKLSIPYFRSQ